MIAAKLIEIIRLNETKIKVGREQEAKDKLGREWEVVTNSHCMGDDEGDTIWMEWDLAI